MEIQQEHNKDFKKLIDTLTDEQIKLLESCLFNEQIRTAKIIDKLQEELNERDSKTRKIMFASGKGY